MKRAVRRISMQRFAFFAAKYYYYYFFGLFLKR